MKIELIEECECENPDWNPPDPQVDKAAWLTYKHRVPHSLKKEPGTVIDDPFAYVHCLPRVDHRGIVRPPRAIPADDECRLMVEGEARTLDRETRAVYERFLAKRKAEAEA